MFPLTRIAATMFRLYTASISTGRRRFRSRRMCRVARLPLVAAAVALTGCQLWPFGERERTSIITPAMRVAAIRESVVRNRNSGANQETLCSELARQIRTEPDPIVRQAIQEAMGEIDLPLAQAVLAAGLNDENFDVQLTSCRVLGERGDPAAVDSLAEVVATSKEDDVRLAAVDALGLIKSPKTIPALALALKDGSPAMQYAGVQAMRRVSDEDVGDSVEAWRNYAKNLSAGDDDSVMARQPGDTSNR